MRILPWRSLALSLLALAAGPVANAATYKLARSVPIGAPDGWDYLSFDAAGHRVLVAHKTETTVLDAASGKILGRLAPLQGAHGQVVLPDGRIFADSGETGTVTIFDGSSYKPQKTVPAGADADGMAFEPGSRRVAVMNGDPGTATLLDAATGATVATVALGGSPESAAAGGSGILFVNIASTAELARVDAASGKVTAHWKLTGCESPHGLAVDPETNLAFPTCLNGKMMVVDGNTGTVRQVLPIGRGTDQAAFDPARHRVFSSNGEGTLSVFEVKGATVQKLDEVKTAPGARTMTVDPVSGRVYLVTAEMSGTRPPGHGGLVPKFTYKPGTVKVLFFDPVS